MNIATYGYGQCYVQYDMFNTMLHNGVQMHNVFVYLIGGSIKQLMRV